jgi:hypothetical protein
MLTIASSDSNPKAGANNESVIATSTCRVDRFAAIDTAICCIADRSTRCDGPSPDRSIALARSTMASSRARMASSPASLKSVSRSSRSRMPNRVYSSGTQSRTTW